MIKKVPLVSGMRESEQIDVGSRLVTQMVKDDGIAQLAINSDMWVSKPPQLRPRIQTARKPGVQI